LADNGLDFKLASQKGIIWKSFAEGRGKVSYREVLDLEALAS
jgi:hypothetical protein